MEEPDLEEGEASYYKDDASIDPDIALSYIDEKLQNVLGHFQKDFEGGVSKDNLGAKFGGYGSFLPTYQRSPPAKSQPKTPQTTQSYSTPRSPNNLHVEGAPQNHTAPSEVPRSLKIGSVSSNKQSLNIPKAASADVSAKKESDFLSAQVAEKLPWKHEPSSSKSVNPLDQRTLKVRIKVGSDNTAKKNSAIYSGLGLISPSLSTENSQEDSGGVAFESQHIPGEYPSSILQGLTVFSVPGGLLLSPLQERLLYLRRNENISLESKPAISFKGRQNDEFMFQDDPASISRAAKVSKGKKTNSVGTFEALEESKQRNGIDFEDKMEYSLKKTTTPDNLESKKCVPHDTKPKPLPGSINDTHDSLKDAVRAPEACMENGVPVKKREVNKRWAKDKLLSTALVKEESSESMYSRSGGKYVQQEAKSSSAEKIREHGVRTSSKDVPLDLREGGKSKVNRVPAPSKAHSDVSKSEKDPSIGAATHIEIEQKVGSKVTPQEQDGSKIPPTKNTPSLGVQKKPKGVRSNAKLASDLVEESLRPHVHVAPKEKKISQKNAHKVRDSYEDVLDIRSGQTAHQMNQLGRPASDRGKEYKLGDVEEREAVNNVRPTTQGVNAEMELGSVAPVVIEEDWVCCDRCQKWRLLPYGTKPEQLPENWWCSMLNWLPGMNRCDISEEETTKALHALYQLPLPESQNNFQNNAGGTAPGVASADVLHFNQNHQNLSFDALSNRGEKKHKSKETPHTASNSGMVKASNFIKKPREEMVECRSLDEMNHHLLETNVMKKSNVQPLSWSGNLAVERHGDELKEKHPNGGDLKQKKLKSKRAPDHSGYETTKKIKTEAAVDTDKYGYYGKDLQKQSAPCDLKGPKLEPKERVLTSVKKHRGCTGVSSGNGSLGLESFEGNKLSAKKRKLKDWEESQNQHLETLRSYGNHLPENKVSLKEEKSDSDETRKEKKSRVSSTLEDSSTKGCDDKTNKKGTVTRIILPASRGNSADKSVKKDLQHRAKVLPKLTMEDVDLLRRDLGSEQFSMGAASSSSKVSDSRKRASLQEVKGSPVESVSSSPMRTSKLSPTRRRKSGQDDVQDGGFPVTGRPRKSLDRLGNFERNQSGASAKGEAPVALPPDSVGLSLPDFHDTNARRKSGAKAESVDKPSSVFENSHFVNSDADTLEQHRDRVNTKHLATSSHKSGKASSLRPSRDKDRSTGYNFQKVKVKASDPSGGQNLIPKKIPNEAHGGQHQLAPQQTNVKHRVSDECSIKSSKDEMTVDKKGSRKRETESRRESLTKTREHDGSDAKLGELTLQKQLIRDFGGGSETKRDPIHLVESRSGKSRFNPGHTGKQEIPAQVPQSVSGNLKGSGCDVRATNGDVLEVSKQPGKAVDPNGTNNGVGNPASNHGVVGDLSGSSTLERDTSGRIATSTLKEAEGLKAIADNLKESGFHFECNEANFQAALNFLHGALLLETCNVESSKHAEMSPIQVYSTAAKLCEMCGQEYEKRQEMDAAALAYKCMEVAYMRIVYCKSSSTNRDRHDLQASLLMVPQGESPSSSASDIDNLNNQTMVDKTALSRGITSHAGNHVIVARNRPNFVRLLDFTNDVNSAMEASRKSSNAFAAANVNLEEVHNKEGIICVKKVIDFSFQDVEEFIRLVRHASGAISRQGFSSNRD